ncbi:MAG: MATE family efflux transporter, partial [Trichlorobacter sp.]|nr:MATE family efflux transporter [Trichlorobacter sp.]
LGTAELAASGIAFRINGIAFFPALGLGQAAGILAGHARGAGRDDDVPAITWQSLLVCELWMLVMALVFAFYPGQLVALFAGSGAEAAEIIKIGIITMRFVAFYCLFDAANVVISSILAAVGETSWLARTFFICTCVFMVLLWGVDLFMPDLILEWALATAFVFITAVLWFFRFKKGVWRQQQVLRQS